MTPDEQTAQEGLKGDEKVVARAKTRYREWRDWESETRTKFTADLKFAWADPTNGWQWPNALWSSRQDDPNGYKPRLTINKVRKLNVAIINEIKKNPVGIKISPVGEDASFKAAQTYMGIIRSIERVSNAPAAYNTAAQFAVDGGMGYFRVVTDYLSDDSFNQEIFIRRIRNPLNVALDPNINELDGSDARWGMVWEDVPNDEFYLQNPTLKDLLSTTVGIETGTDAWQTADHTRVVEYFERTLKSDKLVLMIDPADPERKARVVARWSQVPAKLKPIIEANDSIIQSRPIDMHEMMWYKIAADRVIDKRPWPGKYVPICRVVGEEAVIEGKLDRKGHTRALIDAQKMYNFWTSKATEQVALQTTSRWFMPVGTTDNLEQYYNLINRQNYPFIPYNALDSDGNALPAPTPIDPPQMAEGFIKGMMIAREELNMASGQQAENQGEQSNAISFKAINARQQPGETATYHFKDNLAAALVYAGRIILDLIPHIYDTKQVKRILAKNGDESLVLIDPNAKEAYTEQTDEREGEASIVLNPNVGQYWVAPDVGPGYETQRKEAWNAFVQITAQNQELVTQIGDLMFKYADFPGADEIAERLRRLVPANVLGEGPSPDLQAAMQANEALKKLVAELTDKLAKQELQLTDKQDQREINKFKAESDRLKQIGNAMEDIGEDKLRPLIEQIVRGMMTGNDDPVVGDGRRTGEPADGADDEQPPVEGARRAADGNFYTGDAQSGFSRVEPVQ